MQSKHGFGVNLLPQFSALITTIAMQLPAIVDLPELFIGYDVANEWLYVDLEGSA